MRGKAKRSFNVPFHVGITPAHAGKRASLAVCRTKSRDHPRPCGEKWPPTCRARPRRGSPPPMRGKGSSNSAARSWPWITPAHAGKSIHLMRSALVGEDHPRPCGEKFCLHTGLLGAVGSPPPMRGKVMHLGVAVYAGGITPAHAGKRAPITTKNLSKKDHPRPCGEKTSAQSRVRAAAGSPPPMRGKAWRASKDGDGAGITPAHAGKSLAPFGGCAIHEDHPRPCGEK